MPINEVIADVKHRMDSAINSLNGHFKTLRTGRANAAMLELKEATTEVIDLNGGMVLPGLIDSHVHPVGAAMIEFDHLIPDIESIDDVLSSFRQRAKIVPESSLRVCASNDIPRAKS